MYRDLLVMEGIHKSTGCSLRLLTTHLESQKDGEAERRHQYSIALERLTLYDEGFALVIGDLNIREGEVKKEPLAKVVTDSWVAAGKPPHLKATWDMKLNTNKRFQGNFTPRARFDRCYYHHTDLDDHRITQTSFQFIGTKKMTEGVFPSDHWGLLVGLRITKKGQSFGKI
uniref:Endonuclease/exonuclease/phosphatase domain-containing protein n=2 Tax=Heterosigma akashiwo TaxID=2829 RepID=A0A6V1N862_HETAK|mmetsp:Transcript_4259/g.7753  ORF Transcript_4259/g.7753 Transcript_4259/m.7753 type:complete len:171 (-) Transcript_4259:170-682(-)